MNSETTERLSTGVHGLDEVLNGGFIPKRGYMIRGRAGAGKTILGLHFLEAGIATDETGLFITLEEDIRDLKANADTLGIDTDAIEFLDLSPTADVFTEDQSYEVFDTSEVEQQPLREEILEAVSDIDPDRVVVDPVSQIRYLTAGDYEFRKQVIGLIRFLNQKSATVLFTAQEIDSLPTDQLEFMTDGTVLLGSAPYGRTISVPKYRGSATKSGEHTYRIDGNGIEVFPALEPQKYERNFTAGQLSSGVSEVDKLLNGGLERGTVSVISGPTGVGKTTLGTQFMGEAASRGERSVIYLFEENKETFLSRSENIGIPVHDMVEQGTLRIHEIEALGLSPQEFAQMVRDDVEDANADIVMVDGIAGYRLTLRGNEEMVLQRMHALGRYLKNMGVTSIFVDETKNITGDFTATQENISYLADNIVLLRHLELQGELRKAIGVLKKRTSDFERTLREFEITGDGIRVGQPLKNLQGILTGTPKLVDSANSPDS